MLFEDQGSLCVHCRKDCRLLLLLLSYWAHRAHTLCMLRRVALHQESVGWGVGLA